MNFRELFSKLDELAGNDPVPNKDDMPKTQQPSPTTSTETPGNTIPGMQPQLGPKPTMVAPAVPQGYKQPQAQVVQDPKTDVNAMAQALKAMMTANKPTQPVGLQTPPTSTERVKIGSEEMPTARPGEPLEEKKDPPSPSGDADRMRITRLLTPGTTIDNWVADVRKDPKIYYTIPPEERKKVWAQIEKTDKSLGDKVIAANPGASAQRDSAREAPPKDGDGKKPESGTTTQQQSSDGKKPESGTTTQQQSSDGKKPESGTTTQQQSSDGKKPDGSGATTTQADADQVQQGADSRKRQWAAGVLGYGMGSKDKPNEDVRKMQQKLQSLGYKVNPDGVFRDETRNAVRAFQKDYNLNVDGAAGPRTLPVLAAAQAVEPSSGSGSGQERPAGQTSSGDAGSANLTVSQGARDRFGPQTKDEKDYTSGADLKNLASADELKRLRLNANIPDSATASSATSQSVAAAPAKVETEAERIARTRAELADLERRRQEVADADLLDKYKGVDPKDLIRQTGLSNQPWYNLKGGEIDYDKDGRRLRYEKNPMGGPGEWRADFKSFDDWKKEPGSRIVPPFLRVGPRTDDAEGKAYLDARRARLISPQDAERLDRILAARAQQAQAQSAPVAAAREPVAKVTDKGPRVDPAVDAALNDPARNSANTKEAKGYQPIKVINGVKTFDPFNLGRADANEGVILEGLHENLQQVAEDLLSEDSTNTAGKWATKSAKLMPWVGNVAKGANAAMSAKDVADYTAQGDKVGAGIASAALAADAVGTVFPPASWASFALDMANAGRDVYKKQTAPKDADTPIPTKENSDELEKIKYLTKYKGN